MNSFIRIWLGQLVSSVGSGLTSFALSMWVLKQTGSATQFALISLAAILPLVLLAAPMGVLIDRWGRRRCMLLGDTFTAVNVLATAFLLGWGHFPIWAVYITVTLSSAGQSLQSSAFFAAVSTLVPEQHRVRANAMADMGPIVGVMAAPPLAGFLMSVVPLQRLLWVDFATYCVAVVALLSARFVEPAVKVEDAGEPKGSFWADATEGIRYLRERSDLFALLLFFALCNLIAEIAQVLLVPYSLRTLSGQAAGVVMGAGGVGLMLGALVMVVWPGPRRRVFGILGFTLVQGVAFALMGVGGGLAFVAAAACLSGFTIPTCNALSGAIWQGQVAPERQGRVFAVRSMLGWSTPPLAYVSAGPLADHVFEPLFADGGALAGGWLGTGPGRGIALILIGIGVLTVLLALVASLTRPLRKLDALTAVKDPAPASQLPAEAAAPGL